MVGLWKIWMTIWWWALTLTATAFLAMALPALSAPALVFYDLIHWPLDGQSGFTEATRPTGAILGAVFLGWMLTVRMLINMAAGAAPAAARAIWRGLTGVMLVWYVADSAASILTGVSMNAASNTVILAAYLIPVLASGVLGASSATPVSRSA